MGGKRTLLLCAGSLALAGCALVSGLSNLDIGDAGVVDATVIDGAVEAKADVSTDSSDPRTDGGLAEASAPIAIRCGPDSKKLCAAPNVCCRRGTADAGYTQTCESAQTCPADGPNGSAPVTCDGPSACKNGEVCCAYYASLVAPLSEIKCTSTKCNNYDKEQRMCGTDGGPPSACLTGDLCTPSTGSLPGYFFCQ